jgi:cell division protein FtsL
MRSIREPELGVPGRPRRWRRLRRWYDEFDPWAPRASDYVVGTVVFLLLAIAYVGERSHAVQLNRRLYTQQERASALGAEVEWLEADVTQLADRQRIVALARKLGMQAPPAAAVEYIYFVAGASEP